MKKILWIACLSSLCALTVVSCGDDDDKGKGQTQTVCDVGKFQCAGSVLNQCKASADGKNAWNAVKTCGNNETCNATTGKCDAAGSTPVTCPEAGKFQCSGRILQKCKIGSDSKLTWQTESLCKENETCNATAGKCDSGSSQQKMKVGDSCDYKKGFVEVCQDGDAYYCDDDNKVAVEKCDDSTICMITGMDMAACIPTCNKEGEKSAGCTEDEDYAFQHEIICTKDKTSGMLFWAMSNDTDSYIECDAMCNEDGTACEQMYKQTSESCNPSTYEDRCDENGDVVYCSENSKTVVYYYCSKLKPYNSVCAEFENSKDTWCFAPSEMCDKANDTEEVCYDDDEASYMFTNKCTESKNGKNYWLPFEQGEMCEYECDYEGLKCEEYD